MQIPLQITYRDMEPSEAVNAKIREKAEKIERFADKITSCRVTIESPHKHHHKGQLFSVKIDITCPGEEIVVSRHPEQKHDHEDIYVAIRDAFNAAQRQLEDYTRRRRGKIKNHETAPHGVIKEVYPNMNYGLILTSDGREIYFHRNSVVDADFEKLDTGASVHFTETIGDDGPQASTVHVEGKHHTI